MRQHGHGNGQAPRARRLALVQRHRVLGGQARGLRKKRHQPQRRPAAFLRNQAHSALEQSRVAAKAVDDKALDLARVQLIQHGLGTDDLRNHPAAVNIADQHHRHARGTGKAHIGNVIGAQVHLCRAACPLHQHKVGLCAQMGKALLHRGHQLGL